MKGRSLSVKKRNQSGVALADAVGERVRPAQKQTWIDRLGADEQAGIYEIRQRYKAGGYGAASSASIARAIRELAAENGWNIISEREVADWLRK